LCAVAVNSLTFCCNDLTGQALSVSQEGQAVAIFDLDHPDIRVISGLPGKIFVDLGFCGRGLSNRGSNWRSPASSSSGPTGGPMSQTSSSLIRMTTKMDPASGAPLRTMTTGMAASSHRLR
jgi:hypothetical protein